MPKATDIQTAFTAGEISPKLHGRVEIERYNQGLETLLNMTVFPHGGVTRRPGSKHIAETKAGTTTRVKLVPFEFSTTQSYILEFGENYLRFYRDQGQISASFTITNISKAANAVVTVIDHSLSTGESVQISAVVGDMGADINGEFSIVTVINDTSFSLDDVNSSGFGDYGSGGVASLIQGGPFSADFSSDFDNSGVAEALELTTTYTEDEFDELQFAQSADTLYIVHRDHAPAVLTRTSHTSWSLDNISFTNAPSGWGAGNYPRTIAFFEERLWFGGTPDEPQTLWASKTGDFTNFTKAPFAILAAANGITKANPAVVTVLTTHPFSDGAVITFSNVDGMTEINGRTFTVGTVTDDTTFIPVIGDGDTDLDASGFSAIGTNGRATGVITSDASLEYTIATGKVNAIQWLSAGKVLVIGTVGGEFIASGATTEEAITPTNIRIVRQTAHGSAFMQPIRVSDKVLFVQRAKRKLRQFIFNFDTDGFVAPDITLLAEHITLGGIVEMAYQEEPDSILWVVLGNGNLVALTYQPDQKIVAWHKHILGGASDEAGSTPIVDSVAVIPPVTATGRDEVWIQVKRVKNGGSVVRYIEVIDAGLLDDERVEDSRFLDSYLELDDPVFIEDMTQASPVVVTATAHGFSNGNTVMISNVLANIPTTDDFSSLNKVKFLVANKTANTFEITDIDGNDIDGSELSKYVSGGEARLVVTTITGLEHLNSCVVDILGDGVVLPSETVDSGRITLDTASAKVIVGLGYTSKLKTLKIEAGSADGSAQGKTKRIRRMVARLFRSVGLKIGIDENKLDEVPFRDAADNMDEPIPLFTDDKTLPVPGGFDKKGQLILQQDQPLPLTVLAIVSQVKTND